MVKWTRLQAFMVRSPISVSSLSSWAELEVNCWYVQGQSSSVLLFLYCQANSLKCPLSFSFSLPPFLWSFGEASFMHHIVLKPSFSARHFPSAWGWWLDIFKRDRIWSSSQIFCLVGPAHLLLLVPTAWEHKPASRETRMIYIWFLVVCSRVIIGR